MKWVLVIPVCLFALMSCEHDAFDGNHVFGEESTKLEMAKTIEMMYSDSAINTLKISSPALVRNLEGKEPTQEFPEGLVVEFYDALGNVTGRLSAKYALRYEETSSFIVRDSVVWLSEAGDILETEELTWDKNTDRVYTNKFVVLRRPDEVLYGHGFESNQKFTRWKIHAIEGRLKATELTQELNNR